MDNTGGAAEWSGPDIARASAHGSATSDQDGLGCPARSERNHNAARPWRATHSQCQLSGKAIEAARVGRGLNAKRDHHQES